MWLARILVVTHEFDRFVFRPRAWKSLTSSYLLFGLLLELKQMGHTWRIVAGPRAVRADVAILHVDSTLVGDEYLALAAGYRIAINFATRDISKRQVSLALLSKGDPWAGPVIIKSDLNHFGEPEASLNRRAAGMGRPLPYPGLKRVDDYAVVPSIDDVPEQVWADRGRVVQRFLPEPVGSGFALRTWVFAGSRERCTRHVSPHPMVKAADVVSRTPVEVPAGLRAERKRLGFDYGKFDFVMHAGQPVLLDANRTPGSSAALSRFIRDGARNLAEGCDELIAG